MRTIIRVIQTAAAGALCALIATTIYASVSATNTPSGWVTGGAGVLKPGFDFGTKTHAWVNDGDPLDKMKPAKLNPLATDEAMATDKTAYRVNVSSNSVHRMTVRMKATGSVRVLTENAPDNPDPLTRYLASALRGIQTNNGRVGPFARH